jgi:hypothetical protein
MRPALPTVFTRTIRWRRGLGPRLHADLRHAPRVAVIAEMMRNSFIAATASRRALGNSIDNL